MLLGSDFEEGRKRYTEVAHRLLLLGVRVFSYRTNGSFRLLFYREEEVQCFMGNTHQDVIRQLDSNFTHTLGVVLLTTS